MDYSYDMRQSGAPISYERHVRALTTLGIPIIIGQLGTIIQGLADTIMVGHFSAHSLARPDSSTTS